MMLVALIAAAHAAIEPETGLDRPGADEMVSLPGEGLPGFDAVHVARREIIVGGHLNDGLVVHRLIAGLRLGTLLNALDLSWRPFLIADRRVARLHGGRVVAALEAAGLFRQMSVTAILSVGMVLVIVTGNIDLSVGSAMSLAAVVFSLMILNGFAFLPAFALTLVVGIGMGLLNGSGRSVLALAVTAMAVSAALRRPTRTRTGSGSASRRHSSSVRATG